MKTRAGSLISWVMAALLLMAATGAASAAPISGAIFTTNSSCNGTNVNIFSSKDDVYLDGGPTHPGGAGLPDGYYYVQVTQPDGTLLGTSVGSSTPKPVYVSGGEFSRCYQLSAIVIRASDNQPGYDTTGNSGGEYKVWVSQDASFPESGSKTDNFKVGGGAATPATLRVNKFYDANANGAYDGTDQYITGWKMRIQDGVDLTRYTPVTEILAPDDYTVSEYQPVQTNWMATTETSVDVTLNSGDTKTVEFGNLCLGPGGGLTLGFWSNKNGKALFGDDDLALMVTLNLRDAEGNNFNPTTYDAFRTWLLGGTATNMAYMLSVQLAAMELNVFNGKVSDSALVYAPGTTSANSLGFATINALMAEANAELGLHGFTLADSQYRAYQEALKNALDNANNNKSFVQPTPCGFSFGD